MHLDLTASNCSPSAVFQARAGTMQGLFLTDQPVTDYASAKLCDTDRFAKFFHAMLKRGVYPAPSQFEAGFLSTAHTSKEIEKTVQAAEESFGQ